LAFSHFGLGIDRLDHFVNQRSQRMCWMPFPHVTKRREETGGVILNAWESRWGAAIKTAPSAVIMESSDLFDAIAPPRSVLH
jgi:hypothetical protein